MAVPAAAKAARKITRGLMAAGADRPATAQPLDGLSFVRGRALRRLLRAGVVREAEGGRYWLDGAAYEAWHARRMHRAMWMLLFMGVLFAVLVVLGIVTK
ncbi:MAG TPA: hypothetical protein VFJ16_05885 [Longimicrobium sp.]|nr:hypothetical protein [Longimicrobium sp.]